MIIWVKFILFRHSVFPCLVSILLIRLEWSRLSKLENIIILSCPSQRVTFLKSKKRTTTIIYDKKKYNKSFLAPFFQLVYDIRSP